MDVKELNFCGVDEQNVIDVYIQQIRSVMELATPVWGPGITQQEVRALERVQRPALAIIRGDIHSNYRVALECFKLDTLETQKALFLMFAINTLYSHPVITCNNNGRETN